MNILYIAATINDTLLRFSLSLANKKTRIPREIASAERFIHFIFSVLIIVQHLNLDNTFIVEYGFYAPKSEFADLHQSTSIFRDYVTALIDVDMTILIVISG